MSRLLFKYRFSQLFKFDMQCSGVSITGYEDYRWQDMYAL